MGLVCKAPLRLVATLVEQGRYDEALLVAEAWKRDVLPGVRSQLREQRERAGLTAAIIAVGVAAALVLGLWGIQ